MLAGRACESFEIFGHFPRDGMRRRKLCKPQENCGIMRPMKARDEITEKLRAAIRAAERGGVTNYRLAKDAGISRAAISRFMAGKHGLRLTHAEAIANVIGFTLDLKKITK
jgi:hypothetical protein